VCVIRRLKVNNKNNNNNYYYYYYYYYYYVAAQQRTLRFGGITNALSAWKLWAEFCWN